MKKQAGDKVKESKYNANSDKSKMPENNKNSDLKIIKKDRFEIIKKISDMTHYHVSNIDLKINPPESVYFNCNNCGNCCKNAKFKIPILITDMYSWISSKNSHILRVIDHNSGHPMFRFFFITKEEFNKYMIDNHGESIYRKYLKINPELQPDIINNENKDDCIFYNNELKKCMIYQFRPLACQLYPLLKLMQIPLENLFSKAYKKVAKMKLKERLFKAYIEDGDIFLPRCPQSILQKNDDNKLKVKKSKYAKKITLFVVSTLFSGDLYFKNRRDIYEAVMASLFLK